MTVSFVLNYEDVSIRTLSMTSLLHILRNDFGLKGTKQGCRNGQCGACTVLMNDNPVPSCMVPAFKLHDTRILTIERFAKSREFIDIERGFTEAGVRLCGHCAPGRVLTVHALLEKYTRPDLEEIKQALNASRCRCAGYSALIEGIKIAAHLRYNRNVK